MRNFSLSQSRAHRFSRRPWTAVRITAFGSLLRMPSEHVIFANRLSHLPDAQPPSPKLRSSQQSKAACAARSKHAPVAQFGDCRGTGFPLGILA